MTALATNSPALATATPFVVLRTWIERVVARAELAKLSAAQLEDIGYTFADIDAERAKPFWRD